MKTNQIKKQTCKIRRKKGKPEGRNFFFGCFFGFSGRGSGLPGKKPQCSFRRGQGESVCYKKKIGKKPENDRFQPPRGKGGKVENEPGGKKQQGKGDGVLEG